MKGRRGASFISILSLVFLHLCRTTGLGRIQEDSSLHSVVQQRLQTLPTTTSPLIAKLLVLDLRGGYLYANQNQPIELNPDYKGYVPPPPSSALDEHEQWLVEQAHQSRLITGNVAVDKSASYGSLYSRIMRFVRNIQQTSPSVFWTALSCVFIFALWQIPGMHPTLLKLCVCNRSSVVEAAGLPLILAALSHASLYHLVANMATLIGIAPGVGSEITQPLWPLFLGSALFSNALWVALRRSGSCLGLSGVTMSVIAVQARALPHRVYRIYLAGVLPLALPAGHILQLLLAISLVGSFVRNSRIAHLTHLGGLLFGVLYYELHVNKKRRYGYSRQPVWDSYS
eukprot:scaffold4805_cov136-Cylindrotheca_fusiformis.AAC.3